MAAGAKRVRITNAAGNLGEVDVYNGIEGADPLLAEDLACGQIISVRKEGRHMLSFDVFQGLQRRLEYLLDIVAEHTHHGVSDIGAIV